MFIDDNIDEMDKPAIDENGKDNDYEQTDEVDDETTMEEEEALPELEDPLREIKFLEEVITFILLFMCVRLSTEYSVLLIFIL